jgi:hypothetical protein
MNMKITQIDGLTDTVIEREATEEEAKAIADNQAAAKAIKDAEQAEANAKAEAKAALLDRLGITEEEAQLLLG